MYNIMLVDDEDIFREAIRDTFPWKLLGLNVIGTAGDGLQALEMVKKNVPDIILSDIRMPFMNGIELAGEVKKIYPKVRVILLSAYEDFKYAQEAIRYGARDYLLKPLKEDHLKETLFRITRELDEEKSANESGLYKDNFISFRRETLLKNILKGVYLDRDSIIRNVDEVDLSFLNKNVRVAVCSHDLSYDSYTEQKYREFFIKKLPGLFKDYKLPFLLYNDYIVFFLNDTASISKNTALDVLQSFKDIIEENSAVESKKQELLTIGVGNQYSGLEMISHSYTEAVYAYNCKYFKGMGSIIFFQDINQRYYSALDDNKLQELTESLIRNVFLNNTRDITCQVHEFFSIVEQTGGYSVNDIQIKCIEIMLAISMKMKEKSLNINSLNKKEAVDIIQTMDTVTDLKYWFENKLREISDEITNMNRDNANWFINKAKEYVEKNFADRISVDEISNYLHINSNYFSGSFKKLTGQNFTEYVNVIRIQKAKELIAKSGYRIKEIAGIVGFDNFSYFCTVFKKVTGVSPLEYKSKGLSK